MNIFHSLFYIVGIIMEKIIDTFEKRIGKSIRELTENELIEILKAEEYRDFFKDPDSSLIILDAINQLNKYEKIKKETSLIIFNIKLLRAEAIVDSEFNSYKSNEITRDDLENKVISFIESDDTFLSTVAVSCALISLETIEVRKYKDIIIKNFNGIRETLNIIKSEPDSYPLRISLLEFIFQIREDYFVKYDDDLLKDLDWVNTELDEIHQYEDMAIRKAMPKEINIDPEQLGFIDITKLNEGGE